MDRSLEGEAQKPRLLIIDDQPENVQLLVRILNRAGYFDITTATDPSRALEMHNLSNPDIVLLDLHMPTYNGFTVLKYLEPFTHGDERLPVVMITSDDSAEVKRKALSLGAKDFITKPFDSAEVILRIKNLLETRFLHKQLLQQNSAQLAETMGLGPTVTELVKRAAPLHDIGKVGISDNILLKPGPLTSDERAAMQKHTIIGSEMLANGRSELVRLCQRIARSHHERWMVPDTPMDSPEKTFHSRRALSPLPISWTR